MDIVGFLRDNCFKNGPLFRRYRQLQTPGFFLFISLNGNKFERALIKSQISLKFDAAIIKKLLFFYVEFGDHTHGTPGLERKIHKIVLRGLH